MYKRQDIEIKKDDRGKPFIVLYGNVQKISKNKMINNISLSISHSNTIAVAQVIIED